MKILLLNQFFWPDISATGQLLTDVAADLAGQGHDVTVVCGTPSYGGRRESERPHVRVEYLRGFGFSRGPVTRFLSYLSFLALCLWRTMWLARPDVVVTLTTPPLISIIGTLLKASKGCRHVIWEMDIYPDLAVELGLLRDDAWLTRLCRTLANVARTKADCVIALGECMRRKLISMEVEADRIQVVENWADSEVFHPPLWRDWNGKLRVVYPGNLGLGHDVETLAAAVLALKDSEDVVFQFVGGGKGFEELREMCRARGIRICEFLSYEDPHRLAEERLAAAHVGIVTQKAACSGLLVPSKVYPLMAAGLPFIFVGPRDATPNLLIERHDCGWQIRNGDAEGLVRVLQDLVTSRAPLAAAGNKASEAFLERYERALGTRDVCTAILGQPVSSFATHTEIRLQEENNTSVLDPTP
jgi:colanic acid biosynthesis glycosyl transferase WcaI